MAFGSIEITTVTRAQDYTTIKQNEDNKAWMDQSNIGQNIQRDTERKAQEVPKSEDSDWHSKQFDARDKGDNAYAGDGGKRRKKKEEKDQVIVNGHHGFDIKI